MTQNAKIQFLTPMADQEGVSYRNMSPDMVLSKGIKTDKELAERKTEFPEIDLAYTLDGLFDVIPLSSNKIFARYSGVLADISKAKKEGLDFIELEKEELEEFKKLFAKGIDGRPEYNRRMAFVSNTLDQAYAELIQTQN